MRDFDAEHKKSEIEATADMVAGYANGGDAFMKLKNGKVQNPKYLLDHTRQINLVEGNIVDHIRAVQHWLEEPENQELNSWPEVLNLECQVYMHL